MRILILSLSFVFLCPFQLFAEQAVVNWEQGIKICDSRLSAGWKKSNPFDESEDEHKVEIKGAGTLCSVAKSLSKNSATELRIFTGAGGSDHFSIIGRLYSEAEKDLVSKEIHSELEQASKLLKIQVGPEIFKAIKEFKTEDTRTGDIRTKVDITTREEELRLQPDLDPKSIPLIELEINIFIDTEDEES